MGKFSKLCANAQHEEWGSKTTYLINLHGKIGRKHVFFKAFQQRNHKKPTDGFCVDCLKTCWRKRPYTAKLPPDYKSLSSYTVVSINLFSTFYRVCKHTWT